MNFNLRGENLDGRFELYNIIHSSRCKEEKKKNWQFVSKKHKLADKVEKPPFLSVDNLGISSRLGKSPTACAVLALRGIRVGGSSRGGRHSIGWREGEKKGHTHTQAGRAPDNTGRRGVRFAFVCTRGKERLPNPGYGIEASLPAPVAALYCDFYISSRRGPARSKALCSMHAGGHGSPFSYLAA